MAIIQPLIIFLGNSTTTEAPECNRILIITLYRSTGKQSKVKNVFRDRMTAQILKSITQILRHDPVQSHMPTILVLRRQRQDDQEFKAIFGFIINLRPARAI